MVTETLRPPKAALSPMLILAVSCVSPLAGLTVIEFTVMFAPKFTELTPSIKFVPVKTTSSVCKRLPFVGAMLAKVGAGLFTIKV